MKYIVGIFIALLFVYSCSKEEEKPDCEVNNYGVIRVNYNTTSVNRHKIVITVSGDTVSREKISARFAVTDSVHLSAGLVYDLSISELDNGGSVVNQGVFPVTPVACSDMPITVPF
jgi:hypothetical protein